MTAYIIYGYILAGILGSIIVLFCLFNGGAQAILYLFFFILVCPLIILYYGFYYAFCCCLCSKKSEREEECLGKNFDETVIDMEEPNYQFEDINGVRQDCRGPEGSSGIRGPSPAIPLPYLGFN